jgi:hypothetical protein
MNSSIKKKTFSNFSLINVSLLMTLNLLQKNDSMYFLIYLTTKVKNDCIIHIFKTVTTILKVILNIQFDVCIIWNWKINKDIHSQRISQWFDSTSYYIWEWSKGKEIAVSEKLNKQMDCLNFILYMRKKQRKRNSCMWEKK